MSDNMSYESINTQITKYINKEHNRVLEETNGKFCFYQGTYWCLMKSRAYATLHMTKSKDWVGWPQFMFFRGDILYDILGVDVRGAYYEKGKNNDAFVGATVPDVGVIHSHVSQGIELPVMQFTWKEILVTARYNFYDWKISIRTPEPLDIKDFHGLIRKSDYLLNPVYFEGFPNEYIFAPITAPEYKISSQFSILFNHNYEMWAFFYHLKRWHDGRFGPVYAK